MLSLIVLYLLLFFFFFNDTATTEIYTLSLHDALPISETYGAANDGFVPFADAHIPGDRKSTRLNSSHVSISYAVFCLKKKKNKLYVFCMIRKKNIIVNMSDIDKNV